MSMRTLTFTYLVWPWPFKVWTRVKVTEDNMCTKSYGNHVMHKL